MKNILKFNLAFTICISSLVASTIAHEPIVSHKEKAANFGSLIGAYTKRKPLPDKVYDTLLQYIDKDEEVLDVACGTGLSTYPLLARFHNVRGCDIDERMLEEARKGSSTLFDHADVYHLPYSDESYGLVTVVDAFHWFCDQDSVNEIARVLKPNGYIYPVTNKIVINDTSFRGKVKKVIEEVLGAPIEISKTHFHPEEVLVQNGFEIVYSEDMVLERVFAPKDALTRIQASGDFWSPVQRAGKEQEVLSRLEEVIKDCVDSNGVITEASIINIILAKKKTFQGSASQ